MGCPMKYIYTFACHEDEEQLCRLELSSLFQLSPEAVPMSDRYLMNSLAVDPSRSPFLKLRVSIEYEAVSLTELCSMAEQVQLAGRTFKVVYIETGQTVDYQEQRAVERQVGARVHGQAEMRKPELVLGVVQVDGRWLLGTCLHQEAVWLQHAQKPQNYSTALSTRVARAVVNIAVPITDGVRAIDPCCGIGTVLIEALSMGIDIEGCDMNPLAVKGARRNLAHFGLPQAVTLADMRTFRPESRYDAAILDMPYNLCSKLSEQEKLELLQGARRLAERIVVITIEDIDAAIRQAELQVQARCLLRKGSFSRQVLLCSS
jgi:tRNA G10  N-methylase Trm11